MLRTVSGIGEVIAWTIVLETGASEALQERRPLRLVCSLRGQQKDQQRKEEKATAQCYIETAIRMLAWAFFEAAPAHFSRQQPHLRSKARPAHPILAMKAPIAKLARACYYVMRDQVPFDRRRLVLLLSTQRAYEAKWPTFLKRFRSPVLEHDGPGNHLSDPASPCAASGSLLAV